MTKKRKPATPLQHAENEALLRLEERIGELQRENEQLKAKLTGHEKAEEVLRASEEMYRLVVENATEAIGVVQDGVWKFANPKLTTVTGYTAEELVAKSFLDLVHPDDRQMAADRYVKRTRGEEVPNTYQLRFLDKAGNKGWTEMSVASIEWEGRPATLALMSDITERKWMEEIIRRQRDLAHRLSSVSDLHQGLCICLEAAMDASGMDCGGVYLVEKASGGLRLVCHTGLSEDFVRSTSYYDIHSPSAQMVLANEPIYTRHQAMNVPQNEVKRREGLKAMAIIPFFHEGNILGCLNIASHAVDEVPGSTRELLELMCVEASGAIARLNA